MQDWTGEDQFTLTPTAIADRESNVREADPYYSFYHKWEHVPGCYWFSTESPYEKDGFKHPILYIGQSGKPRSKKSGLLYRSCCHFTNYGESKKSEIIMPLVANGTIIELHVKQIDAHKVEETEGHLIRKYALEIAYPFFKSMGDFCKPPLNDVWGESCGCKICKECDTLRQKSRSTR
jgi:hypothetical protein